MSRLIEMEYNDRTHAIRVQNPVRPEDSVAAEAWERSLARARTAAVKELCEHVPSHLLDTDPSRLPDPTAWASALRDPIEDEPYGVYLFGPTGTAKTRALIEVGCRALLSGASVAYWTAFDLKETLAELRGSKKREFVAEIGSMDEIEVLLVDDFGHVLSESFAEAFRQVLESRDGDVAMTSNYTLDAFVQRSHREKDLGQHAKAIARRLYEGCRLVRFQRPKGPGKAEA